MDDIKKVDGFIVITMEKGTVSLEGLKIDTDVNSMTNGIILDEIRLYVNDHKKKFNNKITILIFDIVKSKEDQEEIILRVVDKYLIKKL